MTVRNTVPTFGIFKALPILRKEGKVSRAIPVAVGADAVAAGQCLCTGTERNRSNQKRSIKIGPIARPTLLPVPAVLETMYPQVHQHTCPCILETMYP
ncbi:hypothetical protein EUGRSUZ_G01284 [Eucalyptus grandis]|uniref:Uncharacterized protein n=2 Tax=Eucalyptus grandis TaxID=71139 RepID=A0ACC3K339_EUCGR|nr:hypothetical protein EUGRSUZ_G01284 [Eucalyptus grandis]